MADHYLTWRRRARPVSMTRESDSQFSPERHVSCSQLSLAAFSSGRATVTQGPLGMGSVIAAG